MIPPVSQNTARPPSANVCLVSCRRVLAQIEKTKSAILGEFRGILQAQEQFLRLALNEAEALAWETEYPHLVFPILATEKARAVVEWYRRQRSLNPTPSRPEFTP